MICGDNMHIRVGKEIRSSEDIRNLIVSIILRQNSDFTKQKIFDLIKEYIHGSEAKIEDDDITSIIEDTLDVLRRNGEVICWNGKYKTKEIH